MANRKSLLNQLRAILLEHGHTFTQGHRVLERAVDEMLAVPPQDLSTRMPGLAKKDTALGASLRNLMAYTHRNVVITALANELARIAWAPLGRGVLIDIGRELTTA